MKKSSECVILERSLMSVILCESVADPNKNDSLWTVDEGDEGVINLIPIPLLLLCNKKILQRLLPK